MVNLGVENKRHVDVREIVKALMYTLSMPPARA